jgi:hypothetical protein
MNEDTPIQHSDTDNADAKTALLSSPTTLLSRAWELYKERLMLFVGILLLPAILTFLFGLLFTEGAGGMFDFSLLNIIGVLLIIAAQLVAAVALLAAVTTDERVLAIKESYETGLAKLLPYLWIAVLIGVITAVGFILFIIPGIIFMVWFSVAFFVFIKEGKGGMEALKGSREYVRGKWWRIFGRIAFIMLFSLILSLLVSLIGALFLQIPGGDVIDGLLGVLLTVVVTPISISYMYFLYRDLRSLGVSQST